MDSHQRRIERLALAIYEAIRATQPQVCMYTSAPEVIDGELDGLDEVGFDGKFNLLKLAEALHGRIS